METLSLNDPKFTLFFYVGTSLINDSKLINVIISIINQGGLWIEKGWRWIHVYYLHRCRDIWLIKYINFLI